MVSRKKTEQKNHSLKGMAYSVSLKDYATITYYQAEGINTDDVFRKMNINEKIWIEVDKEWRKRLEEDESFELIARYSQYYNEAESKE